MINKFLIGGAITLAGAFFGALVEQMSHQWDENVADYNSLLEECNRMSDFIDNHDFYKKSPDLQKDETTGEFVSPNEHWKDFHPSKSMVAAARIKPEVDITENTEDDSMSIKEDKISGLKLIRVK